MTSDPRTLRSLRRRAEDADVSEGEEAWWRSCSWRWRAAVALSLLLLLALALPVTRRDIDRSIDGPSSEAEHAGSPAGSSSTQPQAAVSGSEESASDGTSDGPESDSEVDSSPAPFQLVQQWVVAGEPLKLQPVEGSEPIASELASRRSSRAAAQRALVGPQPRPPAGPRPRLPQ